MPTQKNQNEQNTNENENPEVNTNENINSRQPEAAPEEPNQPYQEEIRQLNELYDAALQSFKKITHSTSEAEYDVTDRELNSDANKGDMEAFFSNMIEFTKVRSKLPYHSAHRSFQNASNASLLSSYAYAFFGKQYLDGIDMIEADSLQSSVIIAARKMVKAENGAEAAALFTDIVTMWDKKEYVAGGRPTWFDASKQIMDAFSACEKKYGTDFTSEVDKYLLNEHKNASTEEIVNYVYNGVITINQDIGRDVYAQSLYDLRTDLRKSPETLAEGEEELTEADCVSRLSRAARYARHYESDHTALQKVSDTKKHLVLAYIEATAKFDNHIFVQNLMYYIGNLDARTDFVKNCLDVFNHDVVWRGAADTSAEDIAFEHPEDMAYVYTQILKAATDIPKDDDLNERLAAAYVAASDKFGDAFLDELGDVLEDYPQVQAKIDEIKANKVLSGGYQPVDQDAFTQAYDQYKNDRKAENEALGDQFKKLPTTAELQETGEILTNSQKSTRKYLCEKFDKARAALRRGPEASDPMSMLKWCKETAMLSPEKLEAYFDRTGLPDNYLEIQDLTRLHLIEKWNSVFNDFPAKHREQLLTYGGAAEIENPDSIKSRTNPDYTLKQALDDLTEAYDNSEIKPAAESGQKDWLKEGNTQLFYHQIPDKQLALLNVATLKQNLKTFQKELNATDHFWMSNSGNFEQLKVKLGETLESIKAYDKKGLSELAKKTAYQNLLKNAGELAEISQTYCSQKAADYKESHKDREKRRGQAASKVSAFARSFVMNEKIKIATKYALNNERIEPELIARNLVDAIQASTKYPQQKLWQDQLSMLTKVAQAKIVKQEGTGSNFINEAINNLEFPETENPEAKKNEIKVAFETLKNRAGEVQREYNNKNIKPVSHENPVADKTVEEHHI